MGKAILLIRVSTFVQTFESQTESVKRQALSDGYLEEDLIIIEDKESATKLEESERNGLNRMKQLIEDPNSDVNCVYAYEISRISRKTKIVYSIRDYLIEHRIQLVICKPYFRLLDAYGKLDSSANIFFGIFATLAEQETYLRIERTLRGKKRLKAEGKWTGGVIRYGYTIDSENNFIINEEDAEIVREIFRLYAIEELSSQSVTKELWDLGKLKQSRFDIAYKMVRKILNCKDYYTGKPYPPLISKEIFDKVQSIKEGRFTRSKTFHKHIYYCEKIIKTMNGYVMTGNAKDAYINKEFQTSISINLIDSIAWELAKFHRIAFDKSNKDNVLKNLIDDIADLETKIDVANEQISKLSKQIDMLEIRLIRGAISSKAAETLEDEIRCDVARLNKEKSGYEIELNIKNKEFKSFDERENNLANEIEKIKDDSVKYNIVHEEIKEIKVERIKRNIVKLWVKFIFDNDYTIYEVNTYQNKLWLSGIEINFDYKKRF